MELIFWTAASLVAYTFFIYPLLLLFLASLHQFRSDVGFALSRKERRQKRSDEDLPTISLIIAAHNEQAVIAAKLRNAASLIYPLEKIEILLGCDGCTDGTAREAALVNVPNVRVLDYARSGKPATLNRLVKEATGEILVFSDANTMFNEDALLALVNHFKNPSIGAVCGELRLIPANGGAVTEGAYWRYECFLKFLESRMNMLVGANGAIFASRSRLFRPLPPATINDDFLTAMSIRKQGYRVLYEPAAIGCEDVSDDVRQEFQRRVRIGRGNLRALKHTWTLLLPNAGLVALSYWSHKVFRWLAPLAMIVSVASALALYAKPFYLACALLGLLSVGMAVAGYLLEARKRPTHALLRILCYFFITNAGLLVGLIKDSLGDRSATWNPTQRTDAATPAHAGKSVISSSS